MSEAPESKKFYGMTDEQLMAHPTVYKDDLFKGQVVLVSGGGSGIGKAIAALFGRLGATVVICSRTEDKLKTTEALLEKIGADCDVQAMTIRDPEQVAGLMEVFET